MADILFRLIQSYGFLALIIVIHQIGVGYELPGITPGYNLVESVASYTFVHMDDSHLWGNVANLIWLMGLFALVERQPLVILGVLIVVCGVIIWAIEISHGGGGSSALSCALMPYIVIRGVLSKEPLGIAVGIATAFFFFGIFMGDVMPWLYGSVNYGHIGGAIGGTAVGIAVSLLNRKN